MIVLGIDPGRHLGAAILDVGGATARALWVAELGVSDAAELVAAIAVLTAARAEHGARVVCVEKVEHVHGSPRMGSAYAEGLATAAWIGGSVATSLRLAGADVSTVEAGIWRRALVGSAQASDAEIARVVRLRVPSWPARSNAHERDAAGIALWRGIAGASYAPMQALLDAVAGPGVYRLAEVRPAPATPAKAHRRRSKRGAA